MADIDRRTGRVIDNYASALQSLEVILTTPLGSRVMLREFGAGLVELLGRLVSVQTFAAFRILLAAAIDLWEPRFRVRGVYVDASVEEIRRGHAGFSVEVDWRPRAHLDPPDLTVEGVRTFGLILAGGQVRFSS